MFGVKWSCRTCGKVHEELPTCFGIEAPWRAFVPEDEFEKRVELTKSLCVVDGETFFIRGHIVIPILNHNEPLTFSVWSSLSEDSFAHVNDRWNDEDRDRDPPYFGWLCTPINAYQNTIHLPLSAQTRQVGIVPSLTVKDDSHPLAVDQRNGISVRRWHEIALSLLA